jgi:hypothetical protein
MSLLKRIIWIRILDGIKTNRPFVAERPVDKFGYYLRRCRMVSFLNQSFYTRSLVQLIQNLLSVNKTQADLLGNLTTFAQIG